MGTMKGADPDGLQKPDMPAGVSVGTLIAYIEQYRPGFGAAIRGASEQEVLKLEALVGQPLPATYRQFLRRMGHDHAGLWLAGEHDESTLEDVADYYHPSYSDTLSAAAQDCLFIAENDLGGVSLLLCPRYAREPQVVMNEPTSYHAASLLSLLYSRAFRTFRLDALVQRRYIAPVESARRDLLPEAVAIVEAAGFRRQWFSERREFCYERPAGQRGPEERGAALLLRQHDYGTSYGDLTLVGGAETAAEAERLVAPFSAQFGQSR